MIFLDEATNEIFYEQDSDQSLIPLYISHSGGYTRAMVRADSKETFRQNAIAVGLLIEYEDEDGIINYRAGPNVTITEEQPDPKDNRTAPHPRIVLQQGVYDEDGNVISEPVFDPRYHANIVIGPNATGDWRQWAKYWTQNGIESTQINANETAIVVNGVELIDPASIRTPANIV